MVFQCQCCLCDCEDDEHVYYKLDQTDDWLVGVYCIECMEEIQANAWDITKSNLLGVDCLAVFRSIQRNGMPMVLVERNLSGEVSSFAELSAMRYNKEDKSIELNSDLTKEQRDNLVKEIQALDAKDVSSEDIKAIAERYWGTAGSKKND